MAFGGTPPQMPDSLRIAKLRVELAHRASCLWGCGPLAHLEWSPPLWASLLASSLKMWVDVYPLPQCMLERKNVKKITKFKWLHPHSICKKYWQMSTEPLDYLFDMQIASRTHKQVQYTSWTCFMSFFCASFLLSCGYSTYQLTLLNYQT